MKIETASKNRTIFRAPGIPTRRAGSEVAIESGNIFVAVPQICNCFSALLLSNGCVGQEETQRSLAGATYIFCSAARGEEQRRRIRYAKAHTRNRSVRQTPA